MARYRTTLRVPDTLPADLRLHTMCMKPLQAVSGTFAMLRSSCMQSLSCMVHTLRRYPCRYPRVCFLIIISQPRAGLLSPGTVRSGRFSQEGWYGEPSGTVRHSKRHLQGTVRLHWKNAVGLREVLFACKMSIPVAATLHHAQLAPARAHDAVQ